MLNKVILIGEVSRSPEIHFFRTQMSVCHFTIKTIEPMKEDSEGNLLPEHIYYHQIKAFTPLSEYVDELLSEGDLCYVEGTLTYRTIAEPTGKVSTRAEIAASAVKKIYSQKDATQAATDTKEQSDQMPPLQDSLPDDLPFF